MDALFKNNAYRILEIFIEFPNEDFSVRGIARRLKLNHATVLKYVNDLLRLGLINKKEETLYPTYYADTENSKYKFYKKNYIAFKINESGLINFIQKQTLASSIILFGSCAKGVFTEKSDVDIFIEHISFEKFLKFWSGIEQSYECLNTGNSYEAYNDYLINHHALRIAKKGCFIPNIELKFVKNDLDRYSLENRKHVKLADRSLYLSPLELQIPYKLFLGSEKDIEDARFLFKLFKDNLNIVLLKMFLIKLKISDSHAKRYLGGFHEN